MEPSEKVTFGLSSDAPTDDRLEDDPALPTTHLLKVAPDVSRPGTK